MHKAIHFTELLERHKLFSFKFIKFLDGVELEKLLVELTVPIKMLLLRSKGSLVILVIL